MKHQRNRILEKLAAKINLSNIWTKRISIQLLWLENVAKKNGILENCSRGVRFITAHAGGENGLVKNAGLIFKSGNGIVIIEESRIPRTFKND